MASTGPGIHGRHLTAEDQVGGAVPFVFKYHTAATGSPFTVVDSAEFPFEVIDAWVVPYAAAAGGTALVANGSNAITDAMTAAVDGDVDRAATMDDAYTTIDKGGSLKVVTANSATADVYILCRKVEG